MAAKKSGPRLQRPVRRPEIQGAAVLRIQHCHICWKLLDPNEQGVTLVVSPASRFYVHDSCAWSLTNKAKEKSK